MRRPLVLFIAALLAAVTLFAVSWQIASRYHTHRALAETYELLWLQGEFELSDETLAGIRELHEAYLPQCGEYCREIADSKSRLNDLLQAGDLSHPGIASTLLEIGTWRAKCQAAMLRHFQATAQAMQPDQGKRYLAVMTQRTLSAHEAVEARMAADQGNTEEHVHPH